MNDRTSCAPRRRRRSSKRRVRGVDYHVSEWGEVGFPLLIYLHGWGDTGSTFQFVVDAFANERHVVAPDWRGFGRSAHVPTGYWFPDYLADLDALLDIYSPDGPSVLVGHSMGANVAALYAGTRPERVKAFVNVEGFGLRDSDPDHAPANYRRWIDRQKQDETYTAFDSLKQLARRIRERSPRMTPECALSVAGEWAMQTADGAVQVRADPAHKLPNPVLYRRAEAEACWRRIAAPVLLVLGEESALREGVRSWTETDDASRPFPGAPLKSISGAGHMVHFEAPAALAAVIEDFLADVANGSVRRASRDGKVSGAE